MPSATFKPREADVIEANRLCFTYGLRSWRQFRAFALGGTLFAALGAWLAFEWQIAPAGLGAAAAAGLVFWTLLLAGILGLNYLRLPSHTRRVFAQHKSLHAETHVTWSEDRIVFESDAGRSRHLWSDFVATTENRTTILLFQTEQLFNFIPKRALSPREAEDLSVRRLGA